MKKYYDVKPRYTSGSPAMVEERIAQRVAQQEKQAYQAYLEGAYGPEGTETATKMGLDWIAWATVESSSNLSLTDLITGMMMLKPIKYDGVRYTPVYADTLTNYSTIAQKLKESKLKTQLWRQMNATGESRTLICVDGALTKEANYIIKRWNDDAEVPNLTCDWRTT